MKAAAALLALAACWRSSSPPASTPEPPPHGPRCGSVPSSRAPSRTAAKGPCAGVEATLSDKRVLVVGERCAAIESNGTWQSVARPSRPTRQPTLTALPGNKALLVGGLQNEALAYIQLFDATTGTWRDAGQLFAPRFAHGAIALRDGRVLVTGGCDDAIEGCAGEGRVSSYELYDPATAKGTLVPFESGEARTNPALVQLADGRVLALGGAQTDSLVPPPTMVWDGSRWCSAPPLLAFRHKPSAELLPDGESVLVTGVVDDGGPAAEVYRFAKDCTCRS